MCERMLCAVVCICILAVVIVEPFASESFRKKNVIKPNSADAARADVRSVLCILAALHRALCTVHTEREHIVFQRITWNCIILLITSLILNALLFALLSLDRTDSESCTHVKSHEISFLSFFCCMFPCCPIPIISSNFSCAFDGNFLVHSFGSLSLSLFHPIAFP